MEKVLSKVLAKLEKFVDTVDPEKLNPQAMKHITATLKDIKDLTGQEQSGLTVRIEFAEESWKE